MRLYTVAGWENNFEVAQSKRIQKELPWVAIPTKHDGKSYRRIMRMADGPQIYCAWVLIVQVAAKCDTRGVLADSDGPLSAEDLEIKTDCPAAIFERAFEVLSDPKIGWLNSREIDETLSTVDGRLSELDQPLIGLRTRTNERTDITNGQTNKVDSIESSESVVDLEDAFVSNAVSKQLAREVRAVSKADRELLGSVGLLVSAKRIPEQWAFDSAAAVAAKGGKAKNPIAYFRSCLEGHCEKAGVDLSKLLGEASSNVGPPACDAAASQGFKFPVAKGPA